MNATGSYSSGNEPAFMKKRVYEIQHHDLRDLPSTPFKVDKVIKNITSLPNLKMYSSVRFLCKI